MMACILETSFLFFFPRAWKISVSGTCELECKGKTRSLELALGPLTGLWFGNPCCTLWGFMHLLDPQDQIGNGVEAFRGGVMCIVGSRGTSFCIKKLSQDKTQNEILEAVWVEVLPLLVEKADWLSRLAIRQRKSLKPEQIELLEGQTCS